MNATTSPDRDRIILSRGAGVWNARDSGIGAALVIELFGTATLPTAYTAEAPAARVLAAIQALNPDKLVELAPAERAS